MRKNNQNKDSIYKLYIYSFCLSDCFETCLDFYRFLPSKNFMVLNRNYISPYNDKYLKTYIFKVMHIYIHFFTFNRYLLKGYIRYCYRNCGYSILQKVLGVAIYHKCNKEWSRENAATQNHPEMRWYSILQTQV